MTARPAVLVLLVLLALLQAQLWFGRGSLPHVAQLRQQLHMQQEANAQSRLVTDQLHAEVNDLKVGLSAVEEHARVELGMVRPGEIFVHYAK